MTGACGAGQRPTRAMIWKLWGVDGLGEAVNTPMDLVLVGGG